MDQVRIGIIGVGNMGSGHAKTITSGQVPDMVLTAIADINPERRKWAAETYPDVKVFDDAITMMESGLVDAVIVAPRTTTIRRWSPPHSSAISCDVRKARGRLHQGRGRGERTGQKEQGDPTPSCSTSAPTACTAK